MDYFSADDTLTSHYTKCLFSTTCVKTRGAGRLDLHCTFPGMYVHWTRLQSLGVHLPAGYIIAADLHYFYKSLVK